MSNTVKIVYNQTFRSGQKAIFGRCVRGGEIQDDLFSVGLPQDVVVQTGYAFSVHFSSSGAKQGKLTR